MTGTVLGLDIGGANLKAAALRGGEFLCQTQSFALWRNPDGLTAALRALLQKLPAADRLAITMTGELCDCFASKREGVLHILDAVTSAAEGRPVHVWTTESSFLDVNAARSAPPLLIAASNWLALATWAGRLVPKGSALLVDVGSTTTDVVPLLEGLPVPLGRTDTVRLRVSELVYMGVRRTPVFAFFPLDAAAEWFATTLDVYLVLGEIPEDPANTETADGRAATVQCASARLARVFCDDPEMCSAQEIFVLAREARRRQVRRLQRAISKVSRCHPSPPKTFILTGEGEVLARAAVEDRIASGRCSVLSITEQLGQATSTAACAHAVAVLCAERT
jgi:probable H4MPT-linked C1 transfer pathway protein